MRARDNQRSRVFKWETYYLDKLPTNQELTLDECKGIIAKVCQQYGKVIPRVADGRGTTYARGGYGRINLPRWARKTVTVLHETAHSIHDGFISYYDKTNQAWHGAEFVRIFIAILSQQKVATRTELMKTARQYKLAIGTLGACPKPKGWQPKLDEAISKIVFEYSTKYHLTEREIKKEIRSFVG